MADNNFSPSLISQLISDLNSNMDQRLQNGQNLNNVNAQLAYLRSIDATLKSMSRTASQSAARDTVFGHNGTFGRQYDNRSYGSVGSSERLGSFSEEFQKQLFEGLLGSDFKDKITKSFDGLAKQLGVDISQLSGKVGQELGKKAMSGLSKTKFGSFLSTQSGKLAGASNAAMSTVGSWLSGGGASFGAVVSSLGSVAAAAAPLAATLFVIDKAFDALVPGIEGMKKLFAAAGKAANRYESSRQRNLELEKQRLEADVKSMIEAPFKILEDAANRVYQAWDNNVRLINGTQGYSKSDLQDLMGAFASRLRDEGLSSVIGATDITEQLAKVLQAGLSGKVAEEFAYQAVKLNAAIPNQDFFGYAATYSSTAANAIRRGRSQAAAIQEANRSLEQFANNLLYASRELSGGFSTGLTNAQSLYEQATKIVQASRTGDVSQVSGVLTAVAGVVGAIAPDLATSLTDAVYSAAVGGNSNSSLVALRSLAGINAGNTDFLRALATNPQKVYSDIFRNLATMYGNNNGAYMEVAEGFSELFGLSMEAFQRIDFNYLADAISNMDISSSALDTNMALLQSGQTTQTKEQQRIAEINKQLIEDGLAYVLDNEVARSIQEHMWAEQIAREQMEATYGVEIQGAAMEALSGIFTTVQNILNFFNPFKWFQKLDNIIATNEEGKALQADVASLLQAGKVGNGNARSLYNLTTRGRQLNLSPSILELYGAQSAYASARSRRESNFQLLTDPLGLGIPDLAYRYNYGGAYSGPDTFSSGSPTSSYRWAILGKSAGVRARSKLLQRRSAGVSNNGISYSGRSPVDNLTNAVQAMVSAANLDKYIENGGYDAWRASAKSHGIADLDSALESAGYAATDVQAYFQGRQTEKGWQAQDEIRQHEKRFREVGIQFWETDFWERYVNPLDTLLKEQFKLVTDRQDLILNAIGFNEDMSLKSWLVEKYLKDSLSHWWEAYSNYYLKHEIYNGGTLQLKALEKVQNKEKAEKGDVVNALSEYLTGNDWNLADLRDPQVQANALLSQILIVVNAIMNQNNQAAGTISLADTFSALAMSGGTSISTTSTSNVRGPSGSGRGMNS